jgi:hypothetical protein
LEQEFCDKINPASRTFKRGLSMHGRLRVSSRLIYASGASLGIILGLIFVFHHRGLADAANVAQIISIIPIFGGIFAWARGRKNSSEPNSDGGDSTSAASAAADGDGAVGEGQQLSGSRPDSTRPQPDLRRRLDGALIIPAALVMCAVLACSVVVVAHFGFGNATTSNIPPKSSSLPSGLTVESNLALTYTNYCTWRLGTHPMPLAAVNPPEFFIDNRCVVPLSADPSDPSDDQQTNLRSGTDHSDTLVTTVQDGDKVLPLCWTTGQDFGITLGTNPPTYESSNLWFEVRAPDGKTGYLPDLYTAGGGYSEQQLTGLGIKRCDLGIPATSHQQDPAPETRVKLSSSSRNDPDGSAAVAHVGTLEEMARAC